MGGLGSGGHAASGEKGLNAAERALVGTKNRAGGSNVRAVPVKVTEFDAPNELTTEERNIWLRLAPGAFAAGTLTKGTEYAFILLCRNVLLEQQLREGAETRGGANHRGILQRVETGLTAFGCRALGKPMVNPEPEEADPFQEFDGGATH